MGRFWQKRLIDIYIIKEVLHPFLVGVAIITIILLSGFLYQLTDFIIIKKVPISLVINLLLYKLPDFIVQTFPISILFATLSGMGRLNRENEFTALRMGGVSLYRLILPLIFWGFFVSALTFFINEEVVPWSNHQAQNIIRRSILKQTMPDIKEDIFFKGPAGRLFYVKAFDEQSNRLEKVVIYNFPEENGFPEIITASGGEIVDNKWILQGVIYHKYTGDGSLTLDLQVAEHEYEVITETDRFFGQQWTTAEMDRKRLKRDIDLFASSGLNVDSLLVDYHLKLSMPLAALIFILIGTPLSLSRKDSRSASIIFTIIVIFLYYLVVSLAQSFGKNGGISPLLAAWIPNLLFALMGIILLIWRETWQKWLHRFFTLLVLPLLLIILTSSGSTAGNTELLRVYSAERIEKISNEGEEQVTISGKVYAQYRKFHIIADQVVIKETGEWEGIMADLDEIVLQTGQFSGCHGKDPHYYFAASEIVIYPGDYLIARNVVFRELNGKLPLFYWPYLYISLKEQEQQLFPEFGYSASRGYFVKTTYYYFDQEHNLPGELYFDYYTISGLAAGIKQYFSDRPDQRGFIYLFGQENRTQLLGLFKWEGEVNLDDTLGNWQTDTNLKIKYYDHYSYLTGRLNLNTRHSGQYLNITSRISNKDYFLSDHQDQRSLTNDLKYKRDLNRNWKLYLDYNHKSLFNPDEDFKERWWGKGYLSRKEQDLDFKLLLERKASNFYSEEEVKFYRWPEAEWKYAPSGPLSYNLILGRYFEEISRSQGYRGLAELKYRESKRLREWLTLNTTQILQGRLYHTANLEQSGLVRINDQPSKLLFYDNYLNASTRITSNLRWYNTYQFETYFGESPFIFDRVGYKERIDSRLSYLTGGLNLSLRGGYDLYNQVFFPLKGAARWQITPNWQVQAATSYNLATTNFTALTLSSNYQDQRWQATNQLKYDLNQRLLRKIDHRLVYELTDQWYLELNTSYDYEEGGLDQARLNISKKFHCRELLFTYNHLETEYVLEYRINLFPRQGVKVGGSETEPFIFELGSRELDFLN